MKENRESRKPTKPRRERLSREEIENEGQKWGFLFKITGELLDFGNFFFFFCLIVKWVFAHWMGHIKQLTSFALPRFLSCENRMNKLH